MIISWRRISWRRRGSRGGGGGDEGSPPSPRPRSGGDNAAAQENAAAARLQDGLAGERGTSNSPAGDSPAGDSADVTLSATRADADGAHTFVDNIVGDPRSVAGRSAQDIADQFTAAGYRANVEQSTRRGTSQRAQQVRVQGHPEITNIQVHPGGGRHTPEGSPYWKISTSTQGKTWVVPRDFRGADELGGNVVRYDE
ncbi:hypothetical protein [Paractinoplanes hotanensis]|uniref:Uncharacterized protein n=1 Tax=Paractinoplanes hotanensis TaxID=2906497 RepID=A0ABT0YBT7_9ACTN|nr:hypothetical protein [Actinoplanes hotanensis]MCM4083521.1 hypothetical protein [Actinoplanes hotanensis]